VTCASARPHTARRSLASSRAVLSQLMQPRGHVVAQRKESSTAAVRTREAWHCRKPARWRAKATPGAV